MPASTRRKAASLVAGGAALLVANHVVYLQVGHAVLVALLIGPTFFLVGLLLLARPHLLGDDPAAIGTADRAAIVVAVLLSLVGGLLLWGYAYPALAPA